MKKINFLVKLVKEGKLELVESSSEIKVSYLEKSESNLISAKILLDNDKLEESICLTYYSMYNILMALLFRIGIKCENHSASIILLKELFEMDNSLISLAKKERIDKQYYTDFNVIKKEVLDAIKETENFNKILLGFIDKITNQEVNGFRIKFCELVNIKN